LRTLLRKTFKSLLNYFNCVGFYVSICGKVGVSGNAKKRKFFIKQGSFSSSTKKTKVIYSKKLINTDTGVLGVTFLLSFI
jgi:ribosomal protein S3